MKTPSGPSRIPGNRHIYEMNEKIPGFEHLIISEKKPNYSKAFNTKFQFDLVLYCQAQCMTVVNKWLYRFPNSWCTENDVLMPY